LNNFCASIAGERGISRRRLAYNALVGCMSHFVEENIMSLRTIVLATSLVALLPLTAIAQGQTFGAGHHRYGAPRGDLGFLAGVTLTDAQKAQIHQLLRASFAATKPLRQQRHAVRAQISDQLASTASVDATQLSGLQQQAEQLGAQIDAQRLATALQIRALLTPDQLAQAAQVHQQLATLRAQMRSLIGQPGGSGSPSAQ
jgi:periplasmic protein CpxP/Spy